MYHQAVGEIGDVGVFLRVLGRLADARVLRPVQDAPGAAGRAGQVGRFVSHQRLVAHHVRLPVDRVARPAPPLDLPDVSVRQVGAVLLDQHDRRAVVLVHLRARARGRPARRLRAVRSDAPAVVPLVVLAGRGLLAGDIRVVVGVSGRGDAGRQGFGGGGLDHRVGGHAAVPGDGDASVRLLFFLVVVVVAVHSTTCARPPAHALTPRDRRSTGPTTSGSSS